MAEPVPVSLGTQSNPGRFTAAGAARLINMYAEKAGQEGKIPWPLYAVDGLREYANFVGAAGSGVRAFQDIEETDTLLAVAGQLLYTLNADGESVSVETVGGVTETGPVTMARNRAANPMVAIAVSGANYIWQGGVLTQSPDPDLPPVNSVDCLDGYFIWGLDDGRMFSSGQDDSTVSGLDFSRNEKNPDGLKRVKVRGSDLLAYGTKTIQPWRNTGEETFPLSMVDGATLDIGLLATTSVATLEQTHYFVAHDGTVRMMVGYRADRISTHFVERLIEDDPNPTMLDATAYERGGHAFYVLSGTNFTVVYDATTGLWHERRSKGMERWRCSQYIKFAGKHLFGHATLPRLYEASPHFYDEDGDELICTVQPPQINLYPYSGILHAVHIDTVPGVGLDPANLPQDVDPQVMVAISKDGGETFGGERMAPIGAMGQRKKRVSMRRWGQFGEDGVVLRISTSAKVRRGLTGLAVEVEKLRA